MADRDTTPGQRCSRGAAVCGSAGPAGAPGGRGFTLVEAAITLAILGLAVGVVLASFGSGRGDLRRAAGELSGTIRAAYDSAALTGRTHRLVFVFDKPIVRVEATEDSLSFDGNMNPLVRGAQAGSAKLSGLAGLLGGAMPKVPAESKEGGEEEEAAPPTALQALVGLNQKAEDRREAKFVATGNAVQLARDVHLLDVWTQGMREPAREGELYLYFFANGYTQDAIIHLQDESGGVFSVRVQSLTGETEIVSQYVEVPR